MASDSRSRYGDHTGLVLDPPLQHGAGRVDRQSVGREGQRRPPFCSRDLRPSRDGRSAVAGGTIGAESVARAAQLGR
jgi:hypothetical protein